MDELKVKFSVGQQGNDGIDNWAYVDMYTLSAASDTQMAANFWRMGNPDITWETTTNYNVGLEFALFGNRLSGSIDYYNKKTTDLLFWLSIPESAGNGRRNSTSPTTGTKSSRCRPRKSATAADIPTVTSGTAWAARSTTICWPTMPA